MRRLSFVLVIAATLSSASVQPRLDKLEIGVERAEAIRAIKLQMGSTWLRTSTILESWIYREETLLKNWPNIGVPTHHTVSSGK